MITLKQSLLNFKVCFMRRKFLLFSPDGVLLFISGGWLLLLLVYVVVDVGVVLAWLDDDDDDDDDEVVDRLSGMLLSVADVGETRRSERG